MPNFYTYFIASLPTLHVGAKPPFSFEKFLQMCEGLIPEDAISLLGSLRTLTDTHKGACAETLKKWYAFETALRNELVKIRASRKHKDAFKYLRNDGGAHPAIAHIASSAHRNPSPLEAEMFLDRQRWQVLDEIIFGHYFDLDVLIVYAQKLLILERWERIKHVHKERLLEEALRGSHVAG